MHASSQRFQHPQLTRRSAIQAGAVGLLGLGMNHVEALRAMAAESDPVRKSKARTVIYIFLSGGLSQLDSFDLKPNAPAGIRGEFKPIATRTPGIQICEHLPMLAERSGLWSLVRSLTHSSNNHSEGHLYMLTGRSDLPPGFSSNMPKDSDWPSMASIVGQVTRPRNNLPPAAILPERLIHNTGRVIPGPYAGMMGRARQPWCIEVSRFESKAYGAYPQYEFDHQKRPYVPKRKVFDAPNLSLPEDMGVGRLGNRLDLLQHIDEQRRDLEQVASSKSFDRNRQNAISMLTDAKVRQAFDVKHAPPKVLERYGNNSFGWSLLMARRLVEAGVNMVQVNLGNNETWDNHGFLFPNLKDKLLPPTDRALSALLDDLNESGLLDSTLVVMAGEFGRTPHIGKATAVYKHPGRDHWGAVQTVLFAGGGIKGGSVVGTSDKYGGHPAANPQTPENMAATIYHSLGLPSHVMWNDAMERPHHIYHGDPIMGL